MFWPRKVSIETAVSRLNRAADCAATGAAQHSTIRSAWGPASCTAYPSTISPSGSRASDVTPGSAVANAPTISA